jgi:uncharacterized protein
VNLTELVVVAAAGVGTAMLTAVAGLGGGLILLVVLLQFLDPLVAVPVHAVIQLVSNSSRAGVLHHHVNRSQVLWSSVLLVPAAVIGLQVATAVPARTARAAIGVFALVATWAPSVFGRLATTAPSRRVFVAVGALNGLTSPTIGATGPLIAPFFRAGSTDRLSFVGTMAAAQALGHATKIAVFAADGFAFPRHLPVILVGSASVAVGTWIGTRLLRRADERVFRYLFHIAITLISLRLLLFP